jgi:heptosyltransferase-2
MNNVEKILIRFPNWIGDLVMATVLLENLKKQYPNALIDVLVKTPFDVLLHDHPLIHKVIGFNPKQSFLQKIRVHPIAKKLKEENYDIGILCTNSLSSLLIFKAAKIKTIIGYKRLFSSFFMKNALERKKTLHQKKQYLELLKPFGLTVFNESLNLSLSKKIVQSGDAKFSTLIEKPFILFHPGASYGSAKTWPLEHFEKLADILLEKTNLQVVFLGAQNQKKPNVIHERLIDLTGKTSLDDVLYLLKKAKACVCNDSGPMHLADALKTPTLAFFGATDPFKTGPSSKSSSIIFNKTTCGPCFKRTCKIGHACMKGITPSQAFSQLEQMGLFLWDT